MFTAAMNVSFIQIHNLLQIIIAVLHSCRGLHSNNRQCKLVKISKSGPPLSTQTDPKNMVKKKTENRIYRRYDVSDIKKKKRHSSVIKVQKHIQE